MLDNACRAAHSSAPDLTAGAHSCKRHTQGAAARELQQAVKDAACPKAGADEGYLQSSAQLSAAPQSARAQQPETYRPVPVGTCSQQQSEPHARLLGSVHADRPWMVDELHELASAARACREQRSQQRALQQRSPEQSRPA